MASPPVSGGPSLSNVNIISNSVKKFGYLKKQKHGHRRFFVLKEQSDGLPARLEYYENEKKWKNKSAAKRVISLDSCLSINKRADAKYKHLIALYTKDEYFAVAAENEQEQESWYRVLTDLMSEGKVYDGSVSNSASSLVGFDEGNYGMITPGSAAYKEVWQVNLKSRGLGQSRNITGVYRLCLSSRTISFVKLNSEVASVSLQLMNIRRCGHSDSFFFIEVGRSASTGPGELWMQADDSVVAQNIHETILEAMKAMKELSEFRPRSKSQSSGSNPISVPTRRNLNNLPPSQTGLVRRSRTDSMAATSPVNRFNSCRIRTASEGDGTMTRPVSVSISEIGSPTVNNHNHINRSNTVSAGSCRVSELSLLHHSRSMSMPVSHSPPAAISPVSLSSTSMNGSSSTSSTTQRPSSCNGSVSGSPSDTGFLSCDDYASSPGEARYSLAVRSDTPSSLSSTPPSREVSDLYGYMMMDRASSHSLNKMRASSRERLDLEKTYRKRTYSLTTPRQQKVPSQLSSASLDEYMLMRAAYTNGHSGRNTHSASPKVSYPEDYGDIEIGSRSSSSNLGDDGYVTMTPGVAPNSGKNDHYMPMSPMCVSAPKQIINPRSHGQTTGSGCTTNSPSSGSLEDSGYMRMWSGSKSSLDSSDGRMVNGDYMNMSPIDPYTSPTPPDYFVGPCEPAQRPSPSQNSATRSNKVQQTSKSGEDNQYVLMSPQSQRPTEESNYYAMTANSGPTSLTSPSAPPPLRHNRAEGLSHRGRINRPNRLSLDTLRMLPSMNEHPLPCEPRSPGEYINIDFGDATRYSPPSVSMESQGSSPGSSTGRRKSPLSDYMNLDLSSHSPKSRDTLSAPLDVLPELSPCPCPPEEGEYFLSEQRSSPCPASTDKDGYAEMKFDDSRISPSFISENEEAATVSPTKRVQRLSLAEQSIPSIGAFLLAGSSLDPDRMAKVIRADPHGRRRHSSETFSSTTTVTPVFPSFAHNAKRHSSASVENVSVRSSEGSDEEYGSPMCRETSAGYQNGLNYIALNLMDSREIGNCENLMSFKTAVGCCKGDVNGLNPNPYACLGFKETATTVKD